MVYETRSKTTHDTHSDDTSARNVQALSSEQDERAAEKSSNVKNVATATTVENKPKNPFETAIGNIVAFMTPEPVSIPSRADGGEVGDTVVNVSASAPAAAMEDDPVVEDDEQTMEHDDKDGIIKIKDLGADGEGDDESTEADDVQAPPSDDAAAKQAIDAIIFSRVGDAVEAVVHEKMLPMQEKLAQLKEENTMLKGQVANLKTGKAVDASDSARLFALEKELKEVKTRSQVSEYERKEEAAKFAGDLKKLGTAFDTASVGSTPAPPTTPLDNGQAIAALAAALEGVTSSSKSGKKLDFTGVHAFAFMKASTHRSLQGARTAVTVEQAKARMPINKALMAELSTATNRENLLIKFNDKMSHIVYVDARRTLVEMLAGWGLYTRTSVDDADAPFVEAQIANRLIESLKHYNNMPGYKRLTIVHSSVSKEDGAVSAEEILSFLDERFTASTGVERSLEITNELDRITIENGHNPTAMIAHAEVMFHKKYPGNAELAEQEARSFIVAQIDKASSVHSFLEPFSTLLSNIEFMAAPLNTWSAQFTVLEKKEAFVSGMALVGAKKKGTAAGKTVGALMGYDTGALNVKGSADEAALLQQAASLLTTGDSAQLGTKEPELNVEFLAKLVAAAMPKAAPSISVDALVAALTGRGERLDEVWVQKNGNTHFASPTDGKRPCIHIGKVAAALGVEIPDKCPKDPHALVGPECPCTHFRGVAPGNWYYAPESDEFKSGKAEYSRVKPADLKEFGYYHKLGKCKIMYKKAHELAKADPSKVTLLIGLPRECKDCLTIE